jgi:hypothetical protein
LCICHSCPVGKAFFFVNSILHGLTFCSEVCKICTLLWNRRSLERKTRLVVRGSRSSQEAVCVALARLYWTAALILSMFLPFVLRRPLLKENSHFLRFFFLLYRKVVTGWWVLSEMGTEISLCFKVWFSFEKPINTHSFLPWSCYFNCMSCDYPHASCYRSLAALWNT